MRASAARPGIRTTVLTGLPCRALRCAVGAARRLIGETSGRPSAAYTGRSWRFSRSDCGQPFARWLHQVLGAAPAAGAQQRVQVQLLEQVALRMAAADRLQLRQRLAQAGDRAAASRRLHAPAARAPRAPRPAATLCATRRAPGPQRLPDGPSRGPAAGAAGAAQPVEVLQVQEGLHVVVPALLQVVRHVLPAIAHVHTGDLQARQQRHRADLVLRVGLDHAPDLAVVEVQHGGGVVQFQLEQRQVPPVVRDHERVQVRPLTAHRVHEVAPLGDAPLRDHHVRQRVLGPGLLGLDRQRAARRRFSLLQQVALLPGEGRHAVQIGHLGGRVQRRLHDAQHAGRVAEVEQVVLPELERGQVARVLARLLLVQRDRARQVALDPGRHGLDKPLLARRDPHGGAARGLDERPGVARRIARFGKHVQRGTAGLHQRAGVGVGHLQDIDHARLAGDEAFDEIVQRAEAVGVCEADGVTKKVVAGGMHGRVSGG
jgi:hypothetical protein